MGLGTPLPTSRAARSVRVSAVKQDVQPTTSYGRTQQEEIYLGFPKNDHAPREGRKGRVIKDDPKKYPNREDLGPFIGAVGGWAGGEVSLWELRDRVKKDQANGTQSSKVLAPSSPVKQPVKSRWNVRPSSSAGRDAIYVGFGKDELELKKAGLQGRVIYDEEYRYPGREDIGPLKGAVGGFAGGERALKSFVETGELKLRKPGDPSVKKQFSPLTLAFLIVFAVAGGGILLTSAFEEGEAGVQQLAQVIGAMASK